MRSAPFDTLDALDLMHPEYDNRMQGFAQPNLDLMGYAVDERAADEAQRDPEQLLKRMSAYLKQSDYQGWIEQDRHGRLAALEADATRHTSQRAAAPAPSKRRLRLRPKTYPRCPSPTARATSASTAFQENRQKDVSDAITALARAYPDSFPVQQKACRFGMQLGMSYKALKPFCDRMTALSMQVH